MTDMEDLKEDTAFAHAVSSLGKGVLFPLSTHHCPLEVLTQRLVVPLKEEHLVDFYFLYITQKGNGIAGRQDRQ